METGGMQAAALDIGDAQESCPLVNPELKLWLAAMVASIALPGTPGAIADASDCAQQPALEVSYIGGIVADGIRRATRQKIAEQAEPGAQYGCGCDLVSECRSRLQDRQRRRREYVAEPCSDRIAQGLVHVVRNRCERSGKPGDGVVRVQGFEL